MKRTLLISLIFAAFCNFSALGNNFSTGQGGISDVAPTFEKGDFVINVGIGFGRAPLGSTGIPPVSVSGEYGLIQDLFTENLHLGIGGILGIQTYTTTHFLHGSETHLSLSFLARAAVHYPLVDDFDVHAGLVTGFRTNPNRMIVGTYIGGRYYLNESFALMAEVGYGITYINLGVAFKF